MSAGHILGIGSLWLPKRVVNETTCDYVGANANRVYQELSGCPSNATLPVDGVFRGTISFGNITEPFLLCEPGRLLDECFLDELMTSSTQGLATLPLSTVSIAMLEDLGYTVDYSQADPYTSADMNASCICNNNNNNEEDPSIRMLRNNNEDDAPTTYHSANERQLSEEGRATVHKYANAELKRMSMMAVSYMKNTMDENGEGGAEIGIPGLSVVFMDEDGEIYTEHIMNGEEELIEEEEEVAMRKAVEEDEDELDDEYADGDE